MRPLVAKGVVPSNRIGELDREQNHVQSDALQTAVLLNQERASKTQTDLQLFTMDNDHREAILVSLNQVDQKIKSIENLMSADKAVAIEAGVSAYVVDGLRKERIRPVVEMAISRHRAYRKLRDELDRTKQALEDRKVIERAKGVLMKAKGLSEDEAHAALRAEAMRESRRLAEVAQAVVAAARLLG